MKTLPETTRPARVFELFDDFAHYTDGDDWTLTATDSGTAAVGDAVGGVLTINASDGTAADNDESYFHTTHELFKFAADKPIRIEARIKFSATHAT